jgi:acylphosphatase
MNEKRQPGSTPSSIAPLPPGGGHCCRFRVSGRVQGVFFRDSTRRMAQQLGITGFAKNEPDGSVLVLACGQQAALEQLAEWLKSGPRLASVDRVLAEPAEVSEVPGSFLVC